MSECLRQATMHRARLYTSQTSSPGAGNGIQILHTSPRDDAKI